MRDGTHRAIDGHSENRRNRSGDADDAGISGASEHSVDAVHLRDRKDPA